jgi:hypothetical protein
MEEFKIELERNNIQIRFGEHTSKVVFMFIENYTLLNRFKWWLFCKVFPFHVDIFEKRHKISKGVE